MKEITVTTNQKEEFIDITEKIVDSLDDLNINNGICVVYTPHTTSAITINENADPDVKSDLLLGLNDIVKKQTFKHMEGNSTAHIKSSIIGCSETIIIQNGEPLLGTWQGIYFCEFDGPRRRKVYVKTIAEK